jgi:hypothetical protein
MVRGWKFVLVAVAALALGCLSPTLPLPPPAAPTETAGTQPGTIHLHGVGVEANSTVIIRNNAPNPSENLSGNQLVNIALADAQGVWDIDNVYAAKGDVLVIWQEFGNNEASPSIDFQVN